MSDSAEPQSEDLRWRIPEGRRRASLRFSLIQIGFATVVVGLLVIVFTPAENHRGLLTAAIALAVAIALVQLVRAFQESRRPANVWLDITGLHWRDPTGREYLLPRNLARGFFLGHDMQTQRELPSLTLLLDDGFLSQPIELHAPASETQVRAWLEQRWSLPEATSLPEHHLVRLPLVSAIDLPDQHWYLEGSREHLAALAVAWEDAAWLPLPPMGARPQQVDLQLNEDLVLLTVSPHTWIDHQLFAATPEVLRQVAREIKAKLAASETPPEFEIPLVTDTGHHWKLVFNIIEE
jgi:hypothetical protein